MTPLLVGLCSCFNDCVTFLNAIPPLSSIYLLFSPGQTVSDVILVSIWRGSVVLIQRGLAPMGELENIVTTLERLLTSSAGSLYTFLYPFIYIYLLIYIQIHPNYPIFIMPPSKTQINLLRGWPSPSLHPTSTLLSAAQYSLTHPSISTPALQYGPDEGYGPLRHAISSWLASFYSVPDDPARICITGGASQNLAAALQVFSDPNITKRVWMVAPCYYLACRIFEDAGFTGRLRAVRQDDEGIDVDTLARELKLLENEEPRGPVSLYILCLLLAVGFLSCQPLGYNT